MFIDINSIKGSFNSWRMKGLISASIVYLLMPSSVVIMSMSRRRIKNKKNLIVNGDYSMGRGFTTS